MVLEVVNTADHDQSVNTADSNQYGVSETTEKILYFTAEE